MKPEYAVHLPLKSDDEINLPLIDIIVNIKQINPLNRNLNALQLWSMLLSL